VNATSSPKVAPTVWRGLSVFGIELDLGPLALRCAPKDAGDALRGLLGRALFEQVCVFGEAGEDRCAGCRFATTCAFPRVFRPQESHRLAPWWLNELAILTSGVRVRIHCLEVVLPSLGTWLHGIAERARRQEGRLCKATDIANGMPIDPTAPRLEAFPFLHPRGHSVEVTTPAGLVSRHGAGHLFDAALQTRIQRLVNQYGDGSFLPREPGWHIVDEEISKSPSGRCRRRSEVWSLRLCLSDLTEAGAELLAAGVLLSAGGETASGRGCLCVTPFTPVFENPSG
jgi:hypothetical protein